MNFHYRIFHFTIRLLARTFGGWKIVGSDNIPTGGSLIAANHISALDPPLIGSAANPDVYYFAKVELFRKPLIGAFLRSVHAFPARRGHADLKAWKTAKSLLTSGKALLFFPEGTRSVDGKLQAAEPGMARLAFATGVPVVPAAIIGSNRLKDVLLRRAKLRVGFAPPVQTTEFEDKENVSRYDRLTAHVLKEIGSLMLKLQEV